MIVEKFVELMHQIPYLMAFCGISVFLTLLFVKSAFPQAWFSTYTKKISHAKTRRGINLFIGVAVTVGLTFLVMFSVCDLVKADFSSLVASSTALLVTLLYLGLEKVLGESNFVELGHALTELVSKSTKFEGELSKSNIIKIAKKLIATVNDIDDKAVKYAVERETAVVDDAIARLSAIVADGQVTEEERAEAEALAEQHGDLLKGTSFWAKYNDALKK